MKNDRSFFSDRFGRIYRNGSGLSIGRTWLFILLCCSLCSKAQSQGNRYSFTQAKMGSPLSITFYLDDSAMAAQIAAQSFALVDSLVNILSDYIDSSELNRLCAHAGRGYFACSPVLFKILLESKKAFEESGGKFDVSIGSLTRLWRSARKNKTFPDSVLVTQTKSLTGFGHLRFDLDNRAVAIDRPGMQIDLGGIGQGFIAEQLGIFLEQQKVRDALIDVSGDIVVIGRPVGTHGWTVGINVPESDQQLLSRRLLLTNKAVTTSGDVYQFFLHDGKKYSHIIDPSTGYGITSQRNVTVIADNGTTADWFTKACSLLPLRKARKLARRLKAEFLITEIQHGRIRYRHTRKFDTYWKK